MQFGELRSANVLRRLSNTAQWKHSPWCPHFPLRPFPTMSKWRRRCRFCGRSSEWGSSATPVVSQDTRSPLNHLTLAKYCISRRGNYSQYGYFSRMALKPTSRDRRHSARPCLIDLNTAGSPRLFLLHSSTRFSTVTRRLGLRNHARALTQARRHDPQLVFCLPSCGDLDGEPESPSRSMQLLIYHMHLYRPLRSTRVRYRWRSGARTSRLGCSQVLARATSQTRSRSSGLARPHHGVVSCWWITWPTGGWEMRAAERRHRRCRRACRRVASSPCRLVRQLTFRWLASQFTASSTTFLITAGSVDVTAVFLSPNTPDVCALRITGSKLRRADLAAPSLGFGAAIASVLVPRRFGEDKRWEVTQCDNLQRH